MTANLSACLKPYENRELHLSLSISYYTLLSFQIFFSRLKPALINQTLSNISNFKVSISINQYQQL